MAEGTLPPVPRAAGTGRVAALTFDDGPNGAATTALLDVLAERRISATFCVVGHQIRRPGGAKVLRRIVADGHLLANHSTTFADMGDWPAEQVRADLEANLRIIRKALGDPGAAVPFFRAPNGSWGQTVDVAHALGMRPLGLGSVIHDWETQDVAILTARLRTAIQPGAVVLAHDGGGDRMGTVAAVRAVLDEFLANGWRFTHPSGSTPPAGALRGRRRRPGCRKPPTGSQSS